MTGFGARELEGNLKGKEGEEDEEARKAKRRVPEYLTTAGRPDQARPGYEV